MNELTDAAKSFLKEKLSERDLKILNILNDELAVRILVKLALEAKNE